MIKNRIAKTCRIITYGLHLCNPATLYKLPYYPRNEISTPAATAEPITPEILLAIQY